MPNILTFSDATAGVTTDALVRVLGMTWTLVWGWFVWSCSLVTAYRREAIIKTIVDDSVYDNRIPPDYEENHPTSVTIQIFVLSFDTVTEASMVTYAGSDSTNLPYNTPRGSGGASPDSSSPPRFDYSVTIFLREHWVDTRLKWPRDDVLHGNDFEGGYGGNNVSSTNCDDTATTDTDHKGQYVTRRSDNDDDDMSAASGLEELERLEVDSKMLDMFWIPDLYFVNDKEASIHDVTMANRMLHVYRNGTVRTSSRISLTLSCDMHLERYPHDEQTCSMYLASYSFSAENVIFNWHELPIIIREGVTLPRFTVELSGTGGCNFNFDQGSMITGNFTCISADFRLTREYGYYVAQVYVPSCLIVTLSWVSFWIDLEAIPARVSLGLLTVLTMTTQSTGEKSTLPKVSYVKAIDVWMAGCLVFVFSALLEFAYVNVQSRVEKRRQSFVTRDCGPAQSRTGNPACPLHNGANAASRQPAGKGAPDVTEVEATISRQHALKRQQQFRRDNLGVEKARRVDKFSRVLFPFAFLIFNIVYWLIYVGAPI